MTDRKQVHAALVAAQAEFPAIAREHVADTGTYKYRYADLADTLAAVRPVLAAHGLAVLQDVVPIDGGRVGIATVLVHTSGESITFGPLPMDAGRSAQQMGSAITYGRRYALTAALGLAVDDDDGAQATPPKPAKAATKKAAAPSRTAGDASADAASVALGFRDADHQHKASARMFAVAKECGYGNLEPDDWRATIHLVTGREVASRRELGPDDMAAVAKWFQDNRR